MPFANSAMSAMNGAHLYFVSMTTVSGSGVLMSLIAESRYPQPCEPVALVCSIENLTSADVIFWPFENSTPGRRWKVYVFLSGERVTDFASHGFTLLPSALTV